MERYEAYKDSGVEWIGEIPKQWVLARTKALFSSNKRIVGAMADSYQRLALTMQGVLVRDKNDSDGLQPEQFEGYQVLEKNELVFKSVGRKLLMATPIDREIKRICKDVNIEPFTMHAFRATFATRAIEGGMNPKTLQEILGHSNFNLTMSLYGHCLLDTKKQAMDSVNIDI